MGIAKTIARIKQTRNQKEIRQDVTEYIKNYHVYAKVKYIRTAKQGQHQAIETPEYPFQRPALDFVTGFPEADDLVTRQPYNQIMTIVDGLTKYAKFIPYRTDIDAK